ncbi:phosphatidylinositol kinase [Nocardioides phosphati]|uniref:Phosphatidylinositol kinase n=1 Tax=Nocardioides phosphati TaxID=1867775 RepID=A0ABQ2NDI1_9ACTN|nr:SCO1664 family protein [Nocardioides phosphati]GGO91791.1 phosphatidylinositol kinase [Nocardioides phosphati]
MPEAAELVLEGRLTTASNATFLARLDGDLVIYKPVAGERPLWDFPGAVLAHREVATYAVSEALGWHVVPRTWLGDGPHGPGMLQEWIEEDGAPPAVDVVLPGEQQPGQRVVLEARDETGRPVLLVHEESAALRRIALLDVLVNNGDRKGGHVLSRGEGRWGIDHGVTFHVEPKLRTVLWGWIDEPLTAAEAGDIARVLADDALLGELRALLPGPEVDAFVARGRALLAAAVFPPPSGDWPAIPWPAL